MNTRQALDPSVRQNRAARRATFLALERAMRAMLAAGQFKQAGRASITSAHLRGVIKNPRLTGAQKDAKFIRAMTLMEDAHATG